MFLFIKKCSVSFLKTKIAAHQYKVKDEFPLNALAVHNSMSFVERGCF